MTAYATAAQLRARINKLTNTDDTVLGQLLQAASNAVDRVTNHAIEGYNVFAATTAAARLYSGSGRRYQWIDECVAVTTVAVKDSPTASTYTAWAGTDWLAFTGGVLAPDFNTLPYTALLCEPNGDYSVFTAGQLGGCAGWDYGLDYQRVDLRSPQVPTVQVTATWGVTATPPDEIREATIMLAARWFKRLESAMSDTLASGDMGVLLYTQPIDPDVKMLLMNTRWYRPQVARRF
jgi:hypothetical protein